MQLSQILSEIDNEIERLQQARTLLTDALVVSPKRREIPTTPRVAKAAKKKTGKRKLSAEGRRKISEALKARWAERKKRASSKASK